MSHSTVLVLFPTKPDDVREAVGEALRPFDENMEVEPYDRPCWCVGVKARNESSVGVQEAIEAASKTFKAPEYDKERYPVFPPKAVQAAWEAHIKPIIDAQEEREKAHPEYQKPNPECDECKGAGTASSTYNPASKWDWYEIGGRWRNLIPDDACPLRDIIDRINNSADEYDGTPDNFTFALLADSTWYEEARMGWFGCTSNEDKDFPTKYRSIANDYSKNHPEAFAVLVDVHI